MNECNTNLRLTVNKQKYMQLGNGQLKEIYIKMKKYWFDRLTDDGKVRHFDTVTFVLGFSNTTMTFRLMDLFAGYGDENCGAPADEKVYVLVVGQRIA